ncbi:hypothetical protein ARAM_006252 [Aspergillus rambellii]|uniref:5'-3' DNA helicase ZGRF1-like N-terminal domain-containing protein n=1 Tax=Aspergillus rambellii TaxID=308745 RepID=A0A0F8WRY5_9EURO|nr:hypothetical protein ARAM_006252 [Aspergillus rambellii]
MSVPLSSATAPRSSNLTVPATQNTAPVIKFRCLYTHDMRRKAKRWQDGFLRYHTFNKRVMVYDNTGYFIGDLHWRQDEGIQDGEELELDKGVLIQVCEQMERTETDITSIYKQNKSHGSPSCPGQTPAASLRSTAATRTSLPSQTSRSLNDLLGINKSSTAQLLSPYEQRSRQRPSTPITPQLQERPAKRKRTASPECNTSSPPGEQSPLELIASSSPELSWSFESCPSTTPRLVNIINRGTAVLPSARASPIHPNAEKRAANPPETRHLPATVHQPVPPKQGPPISSSEAQVNTLRLSGERPRRKLVYQETRHTSQAMSDKTTQPPIPTPTRINPPRPEKTGSSSAVIILDATDDETAPGAYPVRPGQPAARRENPNADNRTGLIVTAAPGQRSKPTEVLASTHTTAPGQPPKSREMATSPLIPLSNQTKLHEQGPWTSEALDLFDFWPPGRPKPS